MRVTPSGTRFSDLQAVVQAWQPMQRVWSMTFAQRVGSGASVRDKVCWLINPPSRAGLGLDLAAGRLASLSC